MCDDYYLDSVATTKNSTMSEIYKTCSCATAEVWPEGKRQNTKFSFWLQPHSIIPWRLESRHKQLDLAQWIWTTITSRLITLSEAEFYINWFFWFASSIGLCYHLPVESSWLRNTLLHNVWTFLILRLNFLKKNSIYFHHSFKLHWGFCAYRLEPLPAMQRHGYTPEKSAVNRGDECEIWLLRIGPTLYHETLSWFWCKGLVSTLLHPSILSPYGLGDPRPSREFAEPSGASKEWLRTNVGFQRAKNREPKMKNEDLIMGGLLQILW